MAEKLEFTDRYDALGIPCPDLETVCKGHCEGTGWVPVKKDNKNERFRALWLEAESEKPSDELGYHFVKCPDCKGTGKKQ